MEKLPSASLYYFSNHQSFIDPIILGGLLSGECSAIASPLGPAKLAEVLCDIGAVAIVVVDPDANLIPAMRAGAFGLRHGVCSFFIEGERSIDGEPKTFKKGAAILSIHLQVPIVPVAIEGFQKRPRGKPSRFAAVQSLGDPMYPPPEADACESAYEELTGELKRRIVGMREKLSVL